MWSLKGNYFFGKSIFFCSFSDIARTFFGLLEEIFVAIVETAFYVSIGSFWEKIFSGKIYNFINTFGHWPKRFDTFIKTYEKVFKAAFYVSTGTFLVEKLLQNFFCKFSGIERYFLGFCQLFFGTVFKTVFCERILLRIVMIS